MGVTCTVDGIETGMITVASNNATDFAVTVIINGSQVVVDGLKLATAISKCLVLTTE